MFTCFRDTVDERITDELGVQPFVVFFTDIDYLDLPNDEFNIVPCKNLDYDNLYKQCLRKDLKIPDGSVIYYVPFCSYNEFNPKIWIPEGIEINSDGTVLIGK